MVATFGGSKTSTQNGKNSDISAQGLWCPFTLPVGILSSNLLETIIEAAESTPETLEVCMMGGICAFERCPEQLFFLSLWKGTPGQGPFDQETEAEASEIDIPPSFPPVRQVTKQREGHGDGAIFYLREKIVAGMAVWNIFYRMLIAGKVSAGLVC
ncbi:hypothetical protein Q9233_007949 [Columba guinea]|nr:hypothetical protein Q9233_007949 [Columba guinea]